MLLQQLRGSRLEAQFHNDNSEPFHRVDQVIIYSKYMRLDDEAILRVTREDVEQVSDRCFGLSKCFVAYIYQPGFRKKLFKLLDFMFKHRGRNNNELPGPCVTTEITGVQTT